MFLKIPLMFHDDVYGNFTLQFCILFATSVQTPQLNLNLKHSHFSCEWRTTLTYTQSVRTVAHLQCLSLCHASSRCACSFLFVLVSVFLIHRAPAVMALGSSCWRAVGSAGIMDREVSNVTAD